MAWDDFLKPKNPTTGEPLPNNNSDGESHPLGDPNASTLANQPTSEENWLEKLRYMADLGNTAAMEKLIDYYASEQSAKTANDLSVQWDSTKYQRLVEDLKKAGLSPYAITGVSAGSLSPVSRSYSGSQMTSQRSQQKTKETNDIKAVLQLLGVVFGALAFAA